MPSAAALQRLKDAQRARQLSGVSGQQQQHLASSSDADNEAYMQQFEQAFSGLSTAGQLSAATPQAQQGVALVKPAHGTSGNNSGKRSQPPTGSAIGTCIPTSSGSSSSISRQSAAVDGHCRAATMSTETPCRRAAAAPGWRTGPVDEAGVLVQLSDRPIVCSAANWASGEVVVGSSDHALYVVDLSAAKKRRTLYSKTTGHTEWVTCVCYLPGGRVLSGGMDGRLWLWPSAGSAGSEVPAAHSAPVSKVACLTPPGQAAAAAAEQAGDGVRRSSRSLASGRAATAAVAGPVLAASCSYDKTVKVWDVSGSRGKQVAVLSGHTAPVLEMDVNVAAGSIVTGDRKGGLMCWDLAAGSSSWGVAAAHQGHITALTWQQYNDATVLPMQHTGAASSRDNSEAGSCSGSCVLTGGQDGLVRVWDGRTGTCTAEQAVHVDKRGKGAVGSIVTGCGRNGRLVVTAGADMTMRLLDPALSYMPIHTVALTDFPYSLAAVGELVVCGCGDGSVHVLDVDNGDTLYALGAGKAAIRALEVAPDRLVCSGDDGYVISYEFC